MRFLLTRSLHLAAVVLTVSLLTFAIVDLLPGDAAHVIGGADSTPEEIEQIRRRLALDRNPAARYAAWMGRVLRGDLGHSYLTGTPVLDTLAERLPVTVELVVVSQLMALFLAIPAGIASASMVGTRVDRLVSAAGFVTLSIPSFVMALLAVYLFAVRLHWLPATGYVPLSVGLWANLRSFVLPGLSIALIEWVVLMRVLRGDLIATLQQNYILLARAKGLPRWKILLHHALRPSSFTLVTICGIQVGRTVGEAVVVETIFALPGIGRLLLEAIYNRDTLMVQGCILLVTITYVLANTGVDMVYALLDPRVRRVDGER